MVAHSACVDPTTGGASSGPSGTGSDGRSCDGKDDCQSCLVCASNAGCAAAESACNQSSECIGLDQCITLCGPDASCKQQCYGGNPGGVAAYEALAACLYCDQCPGDCAGYRSCE